MKKIVITGGELTLEDVVRVSRNGFGVEISPLAIPKMKQSRDMVERVVKEKKVVYGITTGFGKFSDVSISEEDSKQLQKNLIMSHACGVGEPLPIEVVRAMMLLRINALCVGYSGISQSTICSLVNLLNNNIIPVVPCKGSLGASGDLAPLSHVALAMLGMGEVFCDGERMTAEKALNKYGLTPCELTSKEGLALINGTQAMGALGALALVDSKNLSFTADICAAMSIEALKGIVDAFDARIHDLRRQKGQIQTAKNLLKILKGSSRTSRQGELRVQDAYTLRCIPQIHGATKDSLEYVESILTRELNAVTDNPIIFADTFEAISGGNFHGQYLSMAMDFLGIAVAELANVSERRIERMVNPQLSNGLAAFLVKNGGLNSGFMIPQYVAAALVSQNKVLAHPACVDSITSSANQEDHVSMGMTAALKAREIVENVTNVLGIELLTACQAIQLDNAQNKLSPKCRKVFDLVRKDIEFVENDMYLSPLIKKASDIIKSGDVAKAAQI